MGKCGPGILRVNSDADENINQLVDMFSDMFINNENITHNMNEDVDESNNHNINEVRDENNNHNINEVRDENIIHRHLHWIKKLILAALVLFVITIKVIHLLLTSTEENASNGIQSIIHSPNPDIKLGTGNHEPYLSNYGPRLRNQVPHFDYKGTHPGNPSPHLGNLGPHLGNHGPHLRDCRAQ